jgi:general L-amino acid transport system substrate-binding protein
LPKFFACLTAALASALILTAAPAGAGTLETVQKRGKLACGVHPGLPGFGLQDNARWGGFDVDFCRAVAAAVFDDPNKVDFIPLTAKDRFTALQSGEVDLLSRNTTWTLSREAGQGFLFGPITYFDGQAFMVRKKLNVTSALELSGASICVIQGTTTEMNLSDYFRANNMKFEPVTYAYADEALNAYQDGRCDSFTTDMSGLYAERNKLKAPEEHTVLPEVISKEPLGPAVRQGDDAWFNIVKWTHYAMINAEEMGVTSKNVDEKAKSEAPDARRLLGAEGNFGEALGLSRDWAYRIVKHVGNYGEVFDRNLGEGSKLKIKRGVNALWSKGGVQYAPPVR